MAATLEAAQQTILRWRAEPLTFVTQELHAEPDPWQVEALEALPRVSRLGLKACKGPGKSALLAWAVLWFLITRRYAKVPYTSISGGNLRDNLWSELGKWQARSELLRQGFEWTASRFSA